MRVHPDQLERQKIYRPQLVGKNIWRNAYRISTNSSDISRAMEVVVLKFFLHVSREEQRQRILERLEKPAKRWKLSKNDIDERKLWNEYMKAYKNTIRDTSRKPAPWYMVTADNKWITRLVVTHAIIET